MNIHICRNLLSLCLRNPSHLHKPHVSSSFSLLFFSSTRKKQPESGVPAADYLLHKHQFSPETARKVSKVLPFLKNPENSDSNLTFLKDIGFSKTQIESVVKKLPRVLSISLKRNIKPKIKLFRDLGFSQTDIAYIISGDAHVLKCSVNRLGPTILVVKSVLGSSLEWHNVLKICKWFLRSDLKKTVMPNIEFMESLGISLPLIMKTVYYFPRLFLNKPEVVKQFVNTVDGMGFDRNSKMFIVAIRVVSSMSVKSWELKLELFRSLGFAKDDIVSMFRSTPQVFAGSVMKIKKATQLLFATGQVDISRIVNNPELLMYSVEKRIKPRLRVLEILVQKKLLPKRKGLTKIILISHKKFYEKFVVPYSNDVEQIYISRENSS